MIFRESLSLTTLNNFKTANYSQSGLQNMSYILVVITLALFPSFSFSFKDLALLLDNQVRPTPFGGSLVE